MVATYNFGSVYICDVTKTLHCYFYTLVLNVLVCICNSPAMYFYVCVTKSYTRHLFVRCYKQLCIVTFNGLGSNASVNICDIENSLAMHLYICFTKKYLLCYIQLH